MNYGNQGYDQKVLAVSTKVNRCARGAEVHRAGVTLLVPQVPEMAWVRPLAKPIGGRSRHLDLP
jgi:hypothetical protein